MTETKQIVQKWTFGMDRPFDQEIADTKRAIRERESAMRYHEEMLAHEKEKLADLEKRNQPQETDISEVDDGIETESSQGAQDTA